MNARCYIFRKAYLSLKYSSRYPKEKIERLFQYLPFLRWYLGPLHISCFLIPRKWYNEEKTYTYCRLRRSFATAATSEIKYIYGIRLKELPKLVNFLTSKNSKTHLNLVFRIGSEKNSTPLEQNLTTTGPTAFILQTTDLQASSIG